MANVQNVDLSQIPNVAKIFPILEPNKMGVMKDHKMKITLAAFVALAMVGLALTSYLTGFPKEIPGKLYVLIGSGVGVLLIGGGTFMIVNHAAKKRPLHNDLASLLYPKAIAIMEAIIHECEIESKIKKESGKDSTLTTRAKRQEMENNQKNLLLQAKTLRQEASKHYQAALTSLRKACGEQYSNAIDDALHLDINKAREQI